jgi:hypothetical protein
MNDELERIAKLLFKYKGMEQTEDNLIIVNLLEEKEKKLIHEHLK